MEILNIEKTFSFNLCFITSKITASFEFIKQQLDNLFFYKYSYSKIIYGDFAKSLVLAIAK